MDNQPNAVEAKPLKLNVKKNVYHRLCVFRYPAFVAGL